MLAGRSLRTLFQQLVPSVFSVSSHDANNLIDEILGAPTIVGYIC